MQSLKQAGYQVYVFYVKTPLKIAKQRAIYRYEHEGVYGRYLSPNLITESAQKTKRAFDHLLINKNYDGLVIINGLNSQVICYRGKWFLATPLNLQLPICKYSAL